MPSLDQIFISLVSELALFPIVYSHLKERKPSLFREAKGVYFTIGWPFSDGGLMTGGRSFWDCSGLILECIGKHCGGLWHSQDPCPYKRYYVIGLIILFVVLWSVFRPTNSTGSLWPFIKAILSGLWRFLIGVVRLAIRLHIHFVLHSKHYPCYAILFLQFVMMVATVIVVATLIGYLGSQLAFRAPTRPLIDARTTRPSVRMVRNRRSASGSTVQPVLRFLQNMPSRWRIAGTAAGAAGVVPFNREVSPLDLLVAQVRRIPMNVYVATGAILLGAIPYEDVWNYVSNTANRYETMVRSARRMISPGSSP